MIKYVLLIAALLITGISINYFISRNDSSPNQADPQVTLPAVDGKSGKLNAIESELLKQSMPGFKVRRNGPKLLISTTSGQEQIFEDIDTDDNMELYYLVEYRKTPEMLVIFQEDLEGTAFTYLLPNGKQIPANHYLYSSPSGNRAVQINSSKSETDFNGWTIFEKVGDSFKQVAGQSPTEFRDFINAGLQFQSWDNEDSINATLSYSTTQKAEMVTLCAPAKIDLIDGKWILDADLTMAEQDCSDLKDSAAPEYIQDLL